MSGLAAVWREEAIKVVLDPLEGDEALAEEVVDAMGECVPVSWAGLLAILEAHYPEDVFTGASGDCGAHVVALSRMLTSVEEALPRIYDGTHLVDCPYVDALQRIQQTLRGRSDD